MRKYANALPARSLLLLTLSGTLAACGGSNDDSSTDQHDHEHADGGRLIYSITGANDTLKMFDQTVSSNPFTATAVAAQADAQLVLSNDGVTLAMLEGSQLRVISSGLEHMSYADAHAHDVKELSTSAMENVAQVVATTDHFSVRKSDGSGMLLEAADGAEVTGLSWSDIVYPTLALHGDHYLKFTEAAGGVNISVVDDKDVTENIVLRSSDPAATSALFCPTEVKDTAQTDAFTVVLCGDNTMRWLISHEQEDGSVQYVSQKYNWITADEQIGVMVQGGNLEAISDISHLTKTNSEHNAVVAWSNTSTKALWIMFAHGDHPHRTNLTDQIDSTSILSVSASTSHEHDVFAVLGNDSKMAVMSYQTTADGHNLELSGTPDKFSVASDKTWGSSDKLLAAGSSFFVIHKATGALYNIDSHGDSYHVHGDPQINHDLSNISSAVFAHAIEAEHSDDDHDGHDH